MPDVVNPQTVDAVNIGNVKTVAETHAATNAMLQQTIAAAMGVATQDMIAAQARRNSIADAAMTQAVNMLLNVDPLEAMAASKAMTGNDVASQIANLMAAVNANAQGVKSVVQTPPHPPADTQAL